MSIKTTQATELVEVHYWTCTVPEHRHKNKWVAQECIDKHQIRAATPPKRVWTLDKKAAMFEAFVKGATAAEAGRSYGTSSANAQAIIGKLRWRIYRTEPDKATRDALAENFYSEGLRSQPDLWLAALARYRKDHPDG